MLFALTGVSHPSSAPVVGWVQFANPRLHVEVHRPPVHSRDITFAVEHARPQAPQFATSVAKVTSQPFARFPSQLPNPVLHVRPQLPPVQVALAFGYGPQTVVHEPQWLGSPCVFVSQGVPLQFW